MERLTQRFLLYLRAERNASVHTIRAYQHDLKDFLTFLQAKYPRLSPERNHRLVIRDYLASLHERSIRRATLLRAIAVLRAFYKFLIQEGIIPRTPFVGLPMPKREKLLPKFLPEEDMKTLLDIPARSKRKWARRDTALLELLYSSGLRIQELCQLNVQDIDLYGGMVRVFGKGGRSGWCPSGKRR